MGTDKQQEQFASASDSNNETATWTEYLPQAFGIRQAVQESKYRWCARESAMWGIATGTAMSLHRLRMKSLTSTAIHAGFFSFFTVYVGSYFFCVKRRDHRERMVCLPVGFFSSAGVIMVARISRVLQYHLDWPTDYYFFVVRFAITLHRLNS